MNSPIFPRRICPTAGIAACLVTFGLPIVQAQPVMSTPAGVTASTQSPLGLTAVAADRIHAAGMAGTYDFGQASALDLPRVEQTFVLRNDTTVPIVLQRLAPSCHCTTAIVTVPGQDAAALSPGVLPTVAPGGQVSIRVTVDLIGQPDGQVMKSVAVYTQGNQRPVAQLNVSGTLLPSIRFTPALLDFGAVPAGQSRTLSLSVQVDARLWATHPTLVASNADIRLVPQPEVVSHVANFDAAKPGQMRTLPFQVTLSSSAVGGPIRGTVTLVPPVNLSSLAPTLPPETRSVFFNASSQLLGQVDTDVLPSPQTLAFGTVSSGREATRQIVLTGKTEQSITGLKAVSASAYVSARVMDAVPGTSLSRVLEIRLSPTAPPGTLETQLKVTLGNGQRVLIPMSAYVSITPSP